MKKNVIRISIGVLLIISAGLALFFALKSNRLQTELSDKTDQIQMASKQLGVVRDLQEVDSLLVNGKLSEALSEYEQLLNSADPELSNQIEMRIRLVEQLRGNSIPVSTSDSFDIEQLKDSLNSVQRVTPMEVRRYDSLQFALEKMQVQMDQLRRQLRERASGSYLTFTSSKGNTMHYAGEVRNGMANGRGIALLTTGSRYVGQWKNNMRHGQGSFYWPDGEYYTGEYQNDTRTGRGTYFWPSGEKFIGEWEDDERNGKGVFYDEEGEVTARGIWKDDELVEVEKD